MKPSTSQERCKILTVAEGISIGGSIGGEDQAMADQWWRSLITVEPGKRAGRPCVRGMRITVSDVPSYLAAGMTTDEVLADFPYLTAEDIRACLAFDADPSASVLLMS
jgi:uncharacterized protein (DUF433 family)